MLNGTSNEYDLQSVYNVDGFLGVITELSQVCLAIYDTDIIPFPYTGSENIDITYNKISLNLPVKMNDEVVLSPRAYDVAVFGTLPGTDNFAFRLNSTHGGTLIAQFNSSTKIMYFLWGLFDSIFYNKSPIDTLIPNTHDDVYIKTEFDTLFPNIDLSNYYTKTEIDDLDNELSSLVLNTYNKS